MGLGNERVVRQSQMREKRHRKWLTVEDWPFVSIGRKKLKVVT